MSSPLRRGTKIYFRKAVPLDLRKILGKAEIKVSLRTSDIDAARPQFASLNAEWEQRFQSLRKGVTSLSHKEIAALAGEFYKRRVDANEDNPDPDGSRRAHAATDGWLAGNKSTRVVGSPLMMSRVRARLDVSRLEEVDAFLVEQGVRLHPDQMEPLINAVNRMAFEAQKRLVANSEGDYGKDDVRERLPQWIRPEDKVAGPGEEVSKKYDILEIFDQMSRERNHAPSTRGRWRPIIEKVAEEHRDIRSITGDWCVEYKDRLVASGLSSKTIKEAIRVALRLAHQWLGFDLHGHSSHGADRDTPVSHGIVAEVGQRGEVDVDTLARRASLLIE